MARSALATVFALLALIATGCSATGERTDLPAGPEPAAKRPPASEAVVLQIYSGRDFFVPLLGRLSELPTFTLYRDGRVITGFDREATGDPGALPALVERRLSKEEMDAVLRAARRAGLRGVDREYITASRPTGPRRSSY